MDVSWNEVPDFPEFRALTLNDKPLFDGLFQKFPPPISEYTFTNLFIWRHAYGLGLTRLDGFLCLRAEKNGQPFFFPPIGEGDMIECCRRLLHHLGQKGASPKMARVPEAFAAQINGKSGGLRAEPERDQFDYVYLVENLATLKGRKYHRKRNHIKQFKEKYPFEYTPLSSPWLSQCLQLQNAWCDLRRCEAYPGLASEDAAVKEALSNYETLKIKGGAILMEGKVEAFTLGEALNPETVVIHIEKANPAFEGLYPTLNQTFLEKEWSGYKYVNREQDLGEEGLRKAKESYFPDHMVPKYAVTLEGL
jgi:hypothetical protein